MRRLDRYILQEVVLAWLAVTSVLLIILLTNQVAAVLERAADNQYPRAAVLTLIGLSTLQNLPIVMPVGLLLGVVLAFGRLYHESEMTAAQACGVGLGRIYVPITGLALVVTALLAWLTLDLAPRLLGHRMRHQRMNQAGLAASFEDHGVTQRGQPEQQVVPHSTLQQPDVLRQIPHLFRQHGLGDKRQIHLIQKHPPFMGGVQARHQPK